MKELDKIALIGCIRGISNFPWYDEDCRFRMYDSYKCNHSQHCPPNYLKIPPGSSHRHICPECGEVTLVKGSKRR
jgi:hypothetical protein